MIYLGYLRLDPFIYLSQNYPNLPKNVIQIKLSDLDGSQDISRELIY